jgi:hypothetical protein
MVHSFKDVISESALLILRKIEIAQTQERSPTGVERAHCQICQEGEVLDASLIEVSDLTMAEESERNVSRKVMERSAILGTGSAKDLYRPLLSQSVARERADVLEQMMVQEEKDSETENHRQLHGAKVAPKDRKMDQDLRDESSKKDQLSSGLPLLRSKTTNGAPRCDQIPRPPSHLYHLVMAVKHPHPLLLPGPCQLADPS